MPRLENGFVYLWALYSVVLAGVIMAGAAQLWQTKSQRQKEAELLFIGEEFRKAIMSYYNSGNKQFPDSLEDLLRDERLPNVKRHLRKIYVDPMTNTTEWGLVDESQLSSMTPASGANQAAGTNQSTGANQQSSAANPASGTNQATGSNPLSGSNQPASSGLSTGSGQVAGTGQSTGTGSVAGNKSASSGGSNIGTSSIGKRIVGVYSLSERKPIKKDQFPEHIAKFSEAQTYLDWQFVYKPGSESKPASGPAAGAAAKPGAQNSPFSSPSSSSSKSGSSTSPASSGSASPFASPSQSGGSKGAASPFSRSSSDDDD
ncbi:MAG: hypothetical protein E6Q62_08945 [Nitrosomonas sp.]|nr:MAG: hypothetical protein E6Q62_08945 [Nitrosomonas sp.]